MFKFNSILIKIKLFYFILIGKIKKNKNSIQFSDKSKLDINNILIIFPVDEDDFRVALYAFRDLFKSKQINYYFVINSIFKQHFHLKGYTFEFYHYKKNNKIKINETFKEDRILKKQYEFVIDLNKDFIFDIAMIISNINGIYKIGLKNDYSDYFYNIQFNFNKQKSVLEEVYKKIFKIIN